MLTVVSAALRIGDLIISAPPPARHHTLLAVMAEALGVRMSDCPGNVHGLAGQGFLLSDGTFANRAEAFKIARASGQPWLRRIGREHYQGPDLFSEDVW